MNTLKLQVRLRLVLRDFILNLINTLHLLLSRIVILPAILGQESVFIHASYDSYTSWVTT